MRNKEVRNKISRNPIKITVQLVSLAGMALTLGACSGSATGGGSGAASSSSTGTNIYGIVSSISDAESQGNYQVIGHSRTLLQRIFGIHARASSVSGCTVSAYDITGSTVLASGVSDSDGNFTLSSGNLVPGTPYKVVASCGLNAYASVISADDTDPADKSPADVNPDTTLIATQVVAAVTTAITSAINSIGGLSDEAKAILTQSILSPANMGGIISAVTTAVQSAIDSGAIQPPTSDSCKNMALNVAIATDSTTAAAATGAYTGTDGTTAISSTVTSAVTGAASAAAALPGCDASLGSSVASVSLCTQAVAKLMFNVVHFDVLILKTGGAFGTLSGCSDTILSNAFPGAQIVAGTGASGDNPGDKVDPAFCLVHNIVPQIDRNKSYNHYGDGDHNDVSFAETGGSGTYQITSGVLSAMGTALYNNYAYRLSDLDKLVFGYDATKGGLNARLIYSSVTNSWSVDPGQNFSGSYNYKIESVSTLGVSNGVTTSTAITSWPICNSSPCNPDDSNMFSFTSGAWSSATQNASLATAIGNSTWVGSVFASSFAGPIPSASKVNDDIVNKTQHRDENRTGQPNFFVLYSKQPDWSNPNCQWNNNGTTTSYTPQAQPSATPTTQCTAFDGTPQPAVTVNVNKGTVDSSTGISPITSITLASGSAAKFYLYPVMNGPYQGLVQFISAGNGRIMTDEAFHPRYVLVVVDPASQCGQNGIPTTGNGCATGKMYNVSGKWDCAGYCSFSYTALSPSVINTSIPNGTTAYTMNVTFQANQVWSKNGGGGLVGVAPNPSNPENWRGQDSLKIFEVQTGTDGSISNAQLASSGSVDSGWYGITTYWTNCNSNTPCTASGYYLVNSNGVPYTNSGTVASGLTKADVGYCYNSSCSTANNTVIYSDAYFIAVAGSNIPYADNGTGTWTQAALMPVIYMGPAANPTYDCSLDPFFIDSFNDRKIHFTVNSTTGKVTCSNVTFNSTWDVTNYIYDNMNSINYTGSTFGTGSCSTPPGGTIPVACRPNAHPGANIAINEGNAFEYSDPKSVTGLLTTAFGPWLDGNHTLTTTTNLNALQNFGLVFLFLSGDKNLRHIDNLLPNSNNTFYVISPYFSGNDNSNAINTAIAKSVLNNRQP